METTATMTVWPLQCPSSVMERENRGRGSLRKDRFETALLNVFNFPHVSVKQVVLLQAPFRHINSFRLSQKKNSRYTANCYHPHHPKNHQKVSIRDFIWSKSKHMYHLLGEHEATVTSEGPKHHWPQAPIRAQLLCQVRESQISFFFRVYLPILIFLKSLVLLLWIL